jgi:glycosyltransferase involved in cell wall biosynthesis
MTRNPVHQMTRPELMAAGRMRIASYPDRNPGNPYIELFYQALARHGVEHAGRLQPDSAWLDGHGRDVDVVHIHWPERIWRGKITGRLDRAAAWATGRSVRGVWRLRRFLDDAGRRGIFRVWTVHNLAHHEGASPVDRWGYRELARRSDLLLCFSQAARLELEREYGGTVPVLVVSHGSYKGAYPAPRDKAEALAQFGLRADVPVVSCLGLLRRYKGVDLACDAADALAGRVQLLIAGQPQRSFDVDALLRRAAASSGRIVAIPRVLNEREFADATAISDAVLLPYRTVTGSGVLFAAWTMGAGVIASDLPFFREMLEGSPLLGRTFRAADSSDLARAIDSYLAIPRDERRHAIEAVVEELAPERVVAPFVEALRSGHKRRRAGRAAEEN